MSLYIPKPEPEPNCFPRVSGDEPRRVAVAA